MKTFLCFIILLITSLQTFAQVPVTNSENLLDISQRNKPSSGLYQGVPFIKIERTVGAPRPEQTSGWMDAEKKRLFGTTKITENSFFNKAIANAPAPIQSIPEIEYTTPTGKDLTAVYTPHTTDFISFLQVIDNKTLLVEEIIQTINPERGLFSRILPIEKKDVFTADSFQLIRAERNGQPFDLNIEITNEQISLTHPTYLDSGVQSYHLKYIIQTGISVNKNQGIIDYPITGFNWPLPINRFTVLVSFPNKVTPQTKEIVFGSNEASIKDSFTVQNDSNGNTIYRLNNPIPAYASVKLHQTFTGNIISNQTLEYFLTTYISELAVLSVLISIIIYFIISAFYLRFKKPEKNTIQFIQELGPLTLAYLCTGKISSDLTENLFKYYSYISARKKAKLYEYINKYFLRHGLNRLLYLGLYIRLSFKYWVTVFLMVGGMFVLAKMKNICLTFSSVAVTLVISGLCVFLFYRFFGKNAFIKETKIYRRKLVNNNAFCGLNEQAICNLFIRHYPRMRAMEYGADWIKIAEQYAPQIKTLPFVQTQENQYEKQL